MNPKQFTQAVNNLFAERDPLQQHVYNWLMRQDHRSPVETYRLVVENNAVYVGSVPGLMTHKDCRDFVGKYLLEIENLIESQEIEDPEELANIFTHDGRQYFSWCNLAWWAFSTTLDNLAIELGLTDE